jgi:beta-glucosidase
MPTQLIKPEIEQRVESLLGQMTLEEKVGQTNQLMRLTENNKEEIRAGAVGSSIFASTAWAGKDTPDPANADVANEYQRVAMEESRLGIPLLLARDVIHGHRTVFPIPLAQAAAWNPALVEHSAAIAAREGSADGLKWFFTPMLDIARDPRWGRVAEGYGEDPYLGSLNAAAAVRGFQGEDMTQTEKVAACAKHYAGYGLSEGGRDYDRVEVSMRSMRDVYLPPFHAAVQEGVATIMSGFHDFNGIPVAASHTLLTQVLRQEWGFGGFVVSDWNAVMELMQHGIAGDAADAAQRAMLAGVDMDMVSLTYHEQMASLVRSGRVPAEVLDEAVRRILRVKFLTGLFEAPYTDPRRASQVMLTAEHRSAARQMAQEATVLLKNADGLLPLGPDVRDVAVFGPLAHARSELFGSWTLDGRAEDATSIADAMREAAPAGVRVYAHESTGEPAVYHGRSAQVAVIVVGEHPARSGEAASISTLDLPAGQRELIASAKEAGLRIILVVLAGRPLSIGREAAMADAVLYAWHPGVEGGHAVADLIFGAASPSGRLPISFPRAVGQVPVYYSHKNTGRPPQPERFSNGYLDLPTTPLYPFGYGLSYTTFAYSDLQVETPSFPADRQGTFSVSVTNTGGRPGVEVAQLYIRDLVGQVTRPVKELKGFERVALQPGETRQVRFRLPGSALAFAGVQDQMVVEPGRYQVWIGPSSADGLQGEFTLTA